MLNVIKEQKGSTLIVKLSGTIDETVNFEALIGPPPGGEIHVGTKDVTRINSVGVKGWIKYFQAAQQKGAKLKFFDCSTAIVEQLNMISNFTCGGVVESIFVPFSCSNCKSELVGNFKAADLKANKFKLPELKCSKCSGKVIFDDIEEEFFGFLMK